MESVIIKLVLKTPWYSNQVNLDIEKTSDTIHRKKFVQMLNHCQNPI